MLDVMARWNRPLGTPASRLSAGFDRALLAARIRKVLDSWGAPVVYEIFDQRIVLDAPSLPGRQADPEIALAIGDAQGGLLFVAQRERGALGAVSVHETLPDALRDFLGRAMPPAAVTPERIARCLP